jgi:hypothetical protein
VRVANCHESRQATYDNEREDERDKMHDWVIKKASNARVDAAARIHSNIAGRIKLRNTLTPLASNDLFGGDRLESTSMRGVRAIDVSQANSSNRRQ